MPSCIAADANARKHASATAKTLLRERRKRVFEDHPPPANCNVNQRAGCMRQANNLSRES
jgi:hypothetical protein